MGTAHYSLAQKPGDLIKYAKKAAQKIQKLKEKEIRGLTPVLCYRGMSGIAHATALSMELHRLKIDHYMYYSRKKNEKSHGNDKHEYDLDIYNQTRLVLVFVDDFVSSGCTRAETLNGIVELLTSRACACSLYRDEYVESTIYDTSLRVLRDKVTRNLANTKICEPYKVTIKKKELVDA